jgi:uncharacterized protein
MTLRGVSARRVFVDASAFAALFWARDQFHSPAVEIQAELNRAGSLLFTSNFILAEVHALLVSRTGSTTALSALRAIDLSSVTQIHVTTEDEAEARRLLARYQDKTFSLTDALSFVVMEAFGIATAFSFDDDFCQYGFTTL